MKKTIILLIAMSYFVGLIIADGCRAETGETAKPELIVPGNTGFAINIYKKFAETMPGKNIFFSPYSISACLSMVYAGAEAETQKQMAEVLRFKIPEDKLYAAFKKLNNKIISENKTQDSLILSANSLWHQRGYHIQKDYLSLVNNFMDAKISELDFAENPVKSAEEISAWIKDKTRDKIEIDLKGAIDSQTRLVLANAIYFYGVWKTEFDKSETRKADFHATSSKSFEVDMMHKNSDFKYFENKQLQILEMPYKDDKLSMLLLLPREIEGLPGLEEQITYENLNHWQSDAKKTYVSVLLPKFKIKWGMSIKDVLISMGMKDAFNSKADFTDISRLNDLYISDVIHKAYAEVNEKGTEAAAATVTTIRRVSIQIPREFNANHPFIYIIKENETGTILFMGRFSTPEN
jgi:serpin B